MFYHALEIDDGNCIGCSRCMKVCPTEAIRISNGKAFIMEDRCIDCGKCHAACPVDAIYIKQDDFKMVHEFPHSVALLPAVFLGQFPDDIRVSRIYAALKDLGFQACVRGRVSRRHLCRCQTQIRPRTSGRRAAYLQFLPCHRAADTD